MKLVQSLLTSKLKNTDPSRWFNNKQWGDSIEKRRMYWYTWVWSFMSGYKHTKNIELVTDDIGKYILIDALKLPYSSIKIELNNLNQKYWFLGKIKAYSLQTEPFLHYDGDVIFRDYFPKDFSDYNLFGQHLIYCNQGVSFDILMAKNYLILNDYENIPEQLLNIDVNNIRDHKLLNSGVYGGSDLELINKHANIVLKLFDSISHKESINPAKIKNLPFVALFSLCEEILPVLMYKEKYNDYNKIGTIFKTSEIANKEKNLEMENLHFEQQSKKLGYVHLGGLKKVNPKSKIYDEKSIANEQKIRENIIKNVREMYPEQAKIIDLFLSM